MANKLLLKTPTFYVAVSNIFNSVANCNHFFHLAHESVRIVQGIRQCMDIATYSRKNIGDGGIVEIDESKFGKIRYNCGRVVLGKWALGGIHYTAKQWRLFLVPKQRPHYSSDAVPATSRT